MNDCINAEVRDLLPDLLHERLDASVHAVVIAHVEGCVDCRDELQLLRDVLAMSSQRTPRVDVAYIIGALPKAQAPNVIPLAPRRRVWSDWRVAAAVTLMIAGGGSFALVRNGQPTTGVLVAGAAAPSVPAAMPSNTTASAGEERPVSEIGNDNRLGELDESQLGALLEDIQNLKAVPAVEPEPVTIRVDARIASEGV